jgi:hypothetical protein
MRDSSFPPRRLQETPELAAGLMDVPTDGPRSHSQHFGDLLHGKPIDFMKLERHSLPVGKLRQGDSETG